MLSDLFDLGHKLANIVRGEYPDDNEVADLIQAVPDHYANVAYSNAQGNTGTLTATVAGVPGVTWGITSLSVSQSGGSVGPNGKVTIYDGPVGGTVLWAGYLSSPGAPVMSAPGVVTGGLGGSVGIIQDLPMPKTPQGLPGIQATPGNAMNVQVTGTGANNVIINTRFTDGLP